MIKLDKIKKHLRNQNGVLTKYQIIRLGNTLNNMSRKAFFQSAEEADRTDEREDICEYFENNPCKLTDEQIKEGKAFLLKYCLKKSGELRVPFLKNLVNAGYLFMDNKEIAKELAEGLHKIYSFRLVGFERVADCRYLPKYEIRKRGLQWWNYSYDMWNKQILVYGTSSKRHLKCR